MSASNLKLLAWNVLGLNTRAHRSVVHGIVHSVGANIVGLRILCIEGINADDQQYFTLGVSFNRLIEIQ